MIELKVASNMCCREDYTAFAEVCFENFGDRVKHWVTVNEPNIEPIGGYDIGSQPPRRCSYPFGENCTGGNSSTEPYIAAHHLLLAHVSAVSLYRSKYEVSLSSDTRFHCLEHIPKIAE